MQHCCSSQAWILLLSWLERPNASCYKVRRIFSALSISTLSWADVAVCVPGYVRIQTLSTLQKQFCIYSHRQGILVAEVEKPRSKMIVTLFPLIQMEKNPLPQDPRKCLGRLPSISIGLGLENLLQDWNPMGYICHCPPTLPCLTTAHILPLFPHFMAELPLSLDKLLRRKKKSSG